MTPEYTIFYANKLHSEIDELLPYIVEPDGGYLRHRSGQWYHIYNWQQIPVALSDLPPEMQAIALIYFS